MKLTTKEKNLVLEALFNEIRSRQNLMEGMINSLPPEDVLPQMKENIANQISRISAFEQIRK